MSDHECMKRNCVKSMNVSCPPHQIGAIGEQLAQESELSSENETSETEMSEENETSETEMSEETPEEVESVPESAENSDQGLEKPDIAQPTM